MPGTTVISIPVQIDGNQSVQDLILDSGGSITTNNGFNLSSADDVFLFGNINGARGASIGITSVNGSIYVLGRIRAGDGIDATQEGTSGTNGGSVILSAPDGDIIILGNLQSGRGGNGAGAINFPSPADCRGGNGGHGGKINVTAKMITVNGGGIVSGDGGNGGYANSDGWTVEQWSTWIAEHWQSGGLTNLPPPPPEAPIVVTEAEGADPLLEARAGNAGNGGMITLMLNRDGTLGYTAPGVSITSGNGGNVEEAKAVRGVISHALVGIPGNAGDINYAIELPGAGVWTVQSNDTPGVGGNTDNATTGSINESISDIPKGGEGGKVNGILGGGGARGNGGNVGTASATTSVCSNTDGPNQGSAAGPGNAAFARCP